MSASAIIWRTHDILADSVDVTAVMIGYALIDDWKELVESKTSDWEKDDTNRSEWNNKY